MKVFVTGAGALLGQGIIRCLRLAATHYEIVAVDPDPRAVGLYWADRSYLVPMASDSFYAERVAEILNLEKPDIVLVGTDVELMIFAVNKTQLEQIGNTKILVSTPKVIEIADDKWLTYQFLESNGFPCPRSTLAAGVSSLLAACNFPLIVKPRVGARSVGVNLVTNKQELAEAVGSVENAIIQECVANTDCEYTSGLLLSNGKVKSVVTMRRELRDGNTYRAYVKPSCQYDDILSSIAERLGADGPVNLQFRALDGQPYVFEINARFSGTTPLRACAGFNEVDAAIKHVIAGLPIQMPQLHPSVILRYWDEIAIEPTDLERMSSGGKLYRPQYKKTLKT